MRADIDKIGGSFGLLCINKHLADGMYSLDAKSGIVWWGGWVGGQPHPNYSKSTVTSADALTSLGIVLTF